MKKQTKRREVTEVLDDHVSPGDLELTLGELATWFKNLAKKHGADAYLDWNPNYHYPYDPVPSPKYSIRKKRLETDQELAKREADEQRMQLAAEERERAELARLQQKYQTGSK